MPSNTVSDDLIVKHGRPLCRLQGAPWESQLSNMRRLNYLRQKALTIRPYTVFLNSRVLFTFAWVWGENWLKSARHLGGHVTTFRPQFAAYYAQGFNPLLLFSLMDSSYHLLHLNRVITPPPRPAALEALLAELIAQIADYLPPSSVALFSLCNSRLNFILGMRCPQGLYQRTSTLFAGVGPRPIGDSVLLLLSRVTNSSKTQ